MPLQDHLDEFARQIAMSRALRAHSVANITDPDSRALVYESVLARVFRAYENFVESAFLSYLTGEGTIGGASVSRFASPTDVAHARRMLQGSSTYLDWSDPEVARDRCADFLATDGPLATALTGRWDELVWLRRIRNHVAHNSAESSVQYQKVVSTVALVLPSPLPQPGEFLQMIPSKGPLKGREVLAALIDAIEEVALAST